MYVCMYVCSDECMYVMYANVLYEGGCVCMSCMRVTKVRVKELRVKDEVDDDTRGRYLAAK